MTLNFTNFITLNEKGLHYSSDEANAVLSYNPQEMSLHGHIQFATGESYTIENCKKQGHIWKQIDVNNLVEHSVNDIADLSIAVDPPQNQTNRVESTNTLDTVTIVEFSVKIYYTREFATVTQDIAGYLNLMIAETNQGYINSQVPLRIFIHETEEASMREQDDSTSLLYAFTSMKSSVEELRGSADTAVLLVNSMNACGIAFLNTISSGNTVAVVMKSCAVGYYTFGHEIAHSFGCQHDPQTSTNRDYPDGHGHLIPRGQASQGYRTILAYSRTGFETRVNYYSNPGIRHDITNSFTGVRGISNNARILTENRLRMAAVGDESIIGGSTSTASTSEVLISTASTSEVPTSTASTTEGLTSTVQTTEGLSSIATSTESASILGSSSIIELFPTTTNRPETSTAKTAGLINEPAILPTTSSFPLILRPITVTALSSTPSTSSTLTSTLKDDPECCKDSSLPTLSYIFNFQVFARSSLECQKICAAETTCTFWNFYIFNGICDLRQLEYEKNHYWKTSPKICYKPPDYSCRLRNNKFVLSYTPVHANERECRLVCERSYYCEYWAYLTIYDNRPRCRIYFLTSNAYGWISGQFNIMCSNYK